MVGNNIGKVLGLSIQIRRKWHKVTIPTNNSTYQASLNFSFGKEVNSLPA